MVEVLPFKVMKTEAMLRQQILRLVNHGVGQKVIAAKMGVSESWLSRWLRKLEGALAGVRRALGAKAIPNPATTLPKRARARRTARNG